uniref:Prion/Doppel protein beta-ribbon domain-containing protein n=1 Tax=Malurus cyaneus samueli TaxID=2593467 RepID=A0A8C5U196_9PASS
MCDPALMLSVPVPHSHGQAPQHLLPALLLLGVCTDIASPRRAKGKPSGGGWGTGAMPAIRQTQLPPQPGLPHNPGYPTTRATPHNPGYPGWGQGTTHPRRKLPPKAVEAPTQDQLQARAGAAGGGRVGGLGGYAMGRVMSGMHYSFDSPDEYRWWNQNAARYPNQVYYRDYRDHGGPVPQDVFVADCFNITVTEHNIGPAPRKTPRRPARAANQTEAELETRVVTKVIREMCIQQYQEYRAGLGHPAAPHALKKITFMIFL